MTWPKMATGAAAAGIALGSLAMGTSAAPASDAPCATADALATAGYIEVAAQNYAAIKEPCAAAGLRALGAARANAASLVSAAKTAQQSDAPLEQQLALWKAVLGADAANPDAVAAIAALSSSTTTSLPGYDEAQRLAGAGLKPEARAAVAEAVKNGARGKIPSGLASAVDDTPSFSERVHDAENIFQDWILGPLLLVGVALLVGRFLPVRKKSRVVVVAPAIPEDPGASWSAAVRARMRRLTTQTALKVDLGIAETAPTALVLADLDSRLKPLDWILARRAQRKRATLACSLQTEIRSGGVTVELTRGWDNSADAMTLWAPELPTAVTTKVSQIADRLVGVAAGWAIYSLATPEEATATGTNDRLSFAFNVAAADALASGDVTSARLLAGRARAEDPENRVALANMAIATERLAYASPPSEQAKLFAEARAIFLAAIL